MPLDADNIEYDINEDGVLNTSDLIDIVRMVIGQSESSTASDINKDGKVDSADLLMIKKILAK